MSNRTTNKIPLEPDEYSILVISDIHLGEDVSEEIQDNSNKYIKALNDELALFVNSHTSFSSDGHQWHLVINGDMFDFTREQEPNLEEALERWIQREEIQASETAQGLEDTDAPKPASLTHFETRLSLLRILEVHRPLFTELGRFLCAGNKLTMINGNHDAEFYFEDMQDILRGFICSEAEKLNEPGSLTIEQIAGAISFQQWFEASPSFYHLEHGHQYDELCSFEHQLVPLDHSRAKAVATPMSHKILPYFAGVLRDFSTHGVDTWTMTDWIKYILGHGPRLLGLMIAMYIGAMWELLSNAGRKRQKQMGELRQTQGELLEELSKHTHYDLDTLVRLDSLKSPPAEYSISKMMNVFFLDRILLTFLSASVFLIALFIGGLAGTILGTGTLLGAIFFSWLLGKKNSSDIAEDLRRGAAQIAAVTGVQYVVFGHSHEPEILNLAKQVGSLGPFYVNSGSWVTREILRGEEGTGMTFVEIKKTGVVLKQWLGTKQAAAILASTHETKQTRPRSVSTVL